MQRSNVRSVFGKGASGCHITGMDGPRIETFSMQKKSDHSSLQTVKYLAASAAVNPKWTFSTLQLLASMITKCEIAQIIAALFIRALNLLQIYSLSSSFLTRTHKKSAKLSSHPLDLLKSQPQSCLLQFAKHLHLWNEPGLEGECW
jgi:hypothetical protein